MCKRVIYLGLLFVELGQLLAYLMWLEIHKTNDVDQKFLYSFLPYLIVITIYYICSKNVYI